jgi:hypothetical protein
VTQKPGILHIRVELGGRVHEGDLALESKVDLTGAGFAGLNQALADHPGLFAKWATLEILARTKAEGLERERGAKYAELYTHLEAAGASTDADGRRAKPTVEKIKSEILKRPDYKAILERQAVANEELGLLMVARQTMQARKDVLLAVASNLRAEQDAYLHGQLQEVRKRMAGGRT